MLALVAGEGGLPKAIAQAQSEPPLICALEGFAPDGLEPAVSFRLETLGSFLQELQARGVREVCFCGRIARPALDPSRLDAATLPLVPAFMAALKLGDDGALRAVMQIFEEAGFTIRAAHRLLAGLTLPAGFFTRQKPEAAERALAELGDTVLAEMGAADLGQACILGAGGVLAREQDSGTDAMLQACVAAGQARGAVLFKAPKPGQDLRADMPTIGPRTAALAVEAGLAGLILKADEVIVLERAAVVDCLDAAGLFLWVR